MGPDPYDYFATYDAASLTLSNGDRTLDAINGQDWGTAKSSTTKNTGKYYVEFFISGASVNYFSFGIGSIGTSITNYLGSQSLDWGLVNQVSAVRMGGGTAASAFQAPLNSTVMMAVDFDNDKLYYGNDGTWLVGDPTVPSGGVDISSRTGAMYLGVSVGGYVGVLANAVNFGQSAFSYSVPAGYTSGWLI